MRCNRLVLLTTVMCMLESVALLTCHCEQPVSYYVGRRRINGTRGGNTGKRGLKTIVPRQRGDGASQRQTDACFPKNHTCNVWQIRVTHILSEFQLKPACAFDRKSRRRFCKLSYQVGFFFAACLITFTHLLHLL